VHLWITTHRIESGIDATEEVFTQTGPGFLIPSIGFAEVPLDLGINP